MPRDPFVTQLAETLKKLRAEGNTDPSVKEVATALYGVELPSRWVDDIRSIAHRVRDAVEEDGFMITLMNGTYYSIYRHLERLDEDEARRCLCIGTGNRVEGFRFLGDSTDDRIFKAGIQAQMALGNGRIKKWEEKTITAFLNGRLSEASAALILNTSQTQRQFNNPELAQRIMEFEPAQITGEVETRE